MSSVPDLKSLLDFKGDSLDEFVRHNVINIAHLLDLYKNKKKPSPTRYQDGYKHTRSVNLAFFSIWVGGDWPEHLTPCYDRIFEEVSPLILDSFQIPHLYYPGASIERARMWLRSKCWELITGEHWFTEGFPRIHDSQEGLELRDKILNQRIKKIGVIGYCDVGLTVEIYLPPARSDKHPKLWLNAWVRKLNQHCATGHVEVIATETLGFPNKPIPPKKVSL
jgi:hypothetical protein